MAKPMKTLELHYPMIQFLRIQFIPCHRECSLSEYRKSVVDLIFPSWAERMSLIVLVKVFSML